MIRDREPFKRGFMVGSVVALLIYAGLMAKIWNQPSGDLRNPLVTISIRTSEPQTDLAIARAEEINLALAAYVAGCGRELASRAWSDAGMAEERYQLLTSYIPFSPEFLADYMPEAFEIALWEDLRDVRAGGKVDLLLAGEVVTY